MLRKFNPQLFYKTCSSGLRIRMHAKEFSNNVSIERRYIFVSKFQNTEYTISLILRRFFEIQFSLRNRIRILKYFCLKVRYLDGWFTRKNKHWDSRAQDPWKEVQNNIQQICKIHGDRNTRKEKKKPRSPTIK